MALLVVNENTQVTIVRVSTQWVSLTEPIVNIGFILGSMDRLALLLAVNVR